MTVPPPSDFDAERYELQVDDAIRFAHRDHAFFLEAKARALLDLVDRLLGDRSPVRALDVGCGDGRLDSMLDSLGELHGVDASPDMVAAASKAVPRGDFRVADGTRLPFPDGAYDLTFTVCVLHHVSPEQRLGFMRELARVTRDGGLVVVFEHNRWNPLTRLVVRRCAFDEGVELVGRRELRRLAHAAGLTVEETRYILLFPWTSGPFPRLEHSLSALPAGAQYFVAGRPLRRS